ncbi:MULTISPECIES: hypothetical protein [Actinobacillus]|uniref:Lipoprotein n=6 Tax=Actinobacillus TaxID=713 RepID=A3N1U7_ACTP2|nr:MULTISPECIES: hypothetical protein [Actinobacillus]ABN74383.1 hypothetical protein APL_1297 [Actinobacillus pleuropneumoniae serovar 5b str. L20]ABY69866.1 hypothetical protein APJL_1310 [Actinobacillus pleuropneumoniae serovar 3 str. JL03]ASU15128.1 hypothetical protein CHY23_00322 [Actinobacillus pleuropneumoniae]AWG95727.1 hypothetical protein APPSER1_07070 [Actinobacillus pleuropneumoniae serovar 1 str. 4074]AXA21797.1 hypothetical protein DRF63_07065 [Actinobacillus pleuropneumoniae]
MRNRHVFSLLVLLTTVTACSSHQKVQVVKVPATKTEYTQVQNMPNIDSSKIPANVTAICVDGSYSTSPIAEACLGNGGAKQIISRHHSY